LGLDAEVWSGRGHSKTQAAFSCAAPRDCGAFPGRRADVAFMQDRLGHANIQNMMVYMRYTTVTRDAQTRQLFASHHVV